MKRGFTLIEMMIALSISAVMLAAIFGVLSSVWLLAKESSDELQFALKARAMRERLFYGLKDGYGLISAPNISVSGQELVSTLHVGNDESIAYSSLESGQSLVRNVLDSSPSESFAPESAKYRYVYLKISNGSDSSKPGYVAYHDRLVVPLFGKNMTTGDLKEAFYR